MKQFRKYRRKALAIVLAILTVVLSFQIWAYVFPNEARASNLISFDEGYGTTVQDSGSNVTGTITGASWQTNDLCKDERCLYFDGSDWISFGDEATYDFAAATDFSISLWFRHGPASAAEVLVQKYEGTGADGGYRIRMESDGDISFGVDDANGGFADDNISSTSADYDDNMWHHVVAVKDDTTGIYLYIDKILVASDTSIGSTGTLVNDDTFYIGDSDATDNGDEWIGFIDEVKVYTTTARSQAEVNADYLGTTKDRGTSASFGGDRSYLSDGLLGYWKLNESSGNASDSSGNSQTLTDTNTVTFTTGKFANGGDFESGSSQYQYVADNSTLSVTGDLTLAAWINPESVTAATQFDIATKWDSGSESYGLVQYGDEIRMYIDSASNYETTDAVNLATSTWYHVAGVYDAETATVKIYVDGELQASTTTGTIPSSITDEGSRFHIGAEDSAGTADSFYDGIIDEVRVYGDSLSKFEIENMYSWGPGPKAYYPLDENTGTTTAYDLSGNAQNATLTSMTAASWVNGKFGSALEFDGSADSATATIQGVGGVTAPTYIQEAETVWNSSTSPKTTSSFDVETDDILVAYAIRENGLDGSLGISGGSLTWTQQETLDTGDNSQVEMSMWTATVDSDKSMTVSFTSSFGSQYFGGNVLTFRGSEGVGNTAQNDNGTGSGAPTLSFTTSTDNSAVVVANGDWNAADGSSRTWLSNLGSLTESTYDRQSCCYTNYGGYHANAGTAGTANVGLSAPSSQRYVTMGVEVTGSQTAPVNTISFWAKPASTTESIINLNGSQSISISSGTVTATGLTSPTIYVDGVESTTFPDTDWHHISVSSSTVFYPSSFNIGVISSTYYDGALDEIRMYDYVRTADQVVEDMNGGHPIGGSPIGSQALYWAFDEGYGDTANDTIAGNDGDLATSAITCPQAGDSVCPLWQTTGKINGNIYFDGTTDTFDGPDVSFVDGISSMTVSTWVNIDSLATQGNMFGKWASSGTQSNFFVRATNSNSDEIFVFIANATTDAGNNYFTTSDLDLTTGSWIHLTIVYDGTETASNRVKVYKNGQLVNGSVTGTIPTTLTSGSTSNLTMGNNLNSALIAKYDEFKIYTSALDSDQVKVEMNAGSQAALGGVLGNKEVADTTTGAGSTPLLLMDFDENSGTNTLNDKSGNGYNGTMDASMTESDWVRGKYGSALDFDGSDDEITISDNSAFDFTNNAGTQTDYSLMGWFKLDTSWSDASGSSHTIISKRDSSSPNYGWELMLCNDTDCGAGGLSMLHDGNTTGVSLYGDFTNGKTYNANQWYHVAVTYDGSLEIAKMYLDGKLIYNASFTHDIDNSTADILIGGDFVGQFDGILDNIKVYNEVREADQIAMEYNRGAPVGYWQFDECSGTTANDASENSNSGTITPGSGVDPDNNAAGSCSSGNGDEMWNDGTTGKRNASLGFDGSDDYVTIADDNALDLTNGLSISAWVKTDAEAASNVIVSKGTSYEMGINADGDIYWVGGSSEDDASAQVLNGTWHHVVITNDDTTTTYYVDGRQTGTDSSGIAADNATAFLIGSDGTNYFDGLIDDVRLYNYVLSANQIKNIMNNGAVTFGPETGSP